MSWCRLCSLPASPALVAADCHSASRHNWYRFGGGGWSGWHAFDGAQTFTESPAAGTHAPDTLNLYALGTDKRIYERYHLGNGQWSPWASTGDQQFTSSPASASWSNR